MALIAAASVLTMRGSAIWEACRRAGDPGAGAAHEHAAEARLICHSQPRRSARSPITWRPDARRGWTLVLGALYRVGRTGASVFPGYWAIIICIGFTCAFLDGRCRLRIADFIRFCDAAGGTGAASYAALVPDLDAWRSGPSLRPIPMGSRDALVNQFLNNSTSVSSIGSDRDICPHSDDGCGAVQRIAAS